jgi:hypothetical protein
MNLLCQDLIINICYKLNIKDICNLATTSSTINAMLNNFNWKDYFLCFFDDDVKTLYSNIAINKNFVLTLGYFLNKVNDYKIHQQFILYRKIPCFIDNNTILEIKMIGGDGRRLVIDIDDIYYVFSPKGSKMFKTQRLNAWRNEFMKNIINGTKYLSIEILTPDFLHIF